MDDETRTRFDLLDDRFDRLERRLDEMGAEQHLALAEVRGIIGELAVSVATLASGMVGHLEDHRRGDA